MNTSSPGGWRENGSVQKRGSSVCKCIHVFLCLGYLVGYLNPRERSLYFRPSFCFQPCHLPFQCSSSSLSPSLSGGVVSLVLQMKPKPGGFWSLGNPVGTQPVARATTAKVQARRRASVLCAHLRACLRDEFFSFSHLFLSNPSYHSHHPRACVCAKPGWATL